MSCTSIQHTHFLTLSNCDEDDKRDATHYSITQMQLFGRDMVIRLHVRLARYLLALDSKGTSEVA